MVVEKLMEVERYSHVMHISSTVTGRLLPELDAWDALRAALPAGTVSGAPKVIWQHHSAGCLAFKQPIIKPAQVHEKHLAACIPLKHTAVLSRDRTLDWESRGHLHEEYFKRLGSRHALGITCLWGQDTRPASHKCASSAAMSLMGSLCCAGARHADHRRA